MAADLAESYGYSDSVTDGVSPLDALVKAHEMIYGEEFCTAQTEDDYLQMSGSTIRKIFSVPDNPTGFLVNEEYPHTLEQQARLWIHRRFFSGM